MIQEKYSDGHHCFDQLKDYVQTSLSVTQNVQQTRIITKVEQNEDIDQSEIELGENYEYALSRNIKLEESDDSCNVIQNSRILDNTGKNQPKLTDKD